MSKKKLLLTALALVLVCVCSIAGSLAFLTETSNGGNGITNTFVAGKGLLEDPPEGKADFSIVETPVTQNEDGTYVPTSEATPGTSGITYTILPGQELPKDTAINIVGKTDTAAYLFVEVVDNMTADIYEWAIDENNWIATGLKGLHNGDVYAYTTDKTNAALLTEDPEAPIPVLDGNKVVVKDVDVSSVTGDTLAFYGYMAQASAGKTAGDAFTACGFEYVAPQP